MLLMTFKQLGVCIFQEFCKNSTKFHILRIKEKIKYGEWGWNKFRKKYQFLSVELDAIVYM